MQEQDKLAERRQRANDRKREQYRVLNGGVVRDYVRCANEEEKIDRLRQQRREACERFRIRYPDGKARHDDPGHVERRGRKKATAVTGATSP